MPKVQNSIKHFAINELENILKSEVSLGSLQIEPFNRVSLIDFCAYDLKKDTLLSAEKIAVGIELLPLFNKEIVLRSVQLFGFDAHMQKQSPDAPLNIQFILDAFKPTSVDTVPSRVQVKINSALLRRGRFRYDVVSEPLLKKGVFNANHISVEQINGTVAVKTIESDSLNIQLKRLSFKEANGLELKNLALKMIKNKEGYLLSQFTLALPQSRVNIDDCYLRTATVEREAQFCDSAEMRINITPSYITPSDLSVFLPQLANIKQPIDISTLIVGTVNNMHLQLFDMKMGEDLDFSLGGSLVGITDPNTAYLFGKVKKLEIKSAAINTILTNFVPTLNPMPPVLANLNNLKFNGEISGFLSNLVAYGVLRTNVGMLKADMMIGNITQKNNLQLKGSVSSTNLALSSLLPIGNPMGDIGFNFRVNLKQKNSAIPVGELKGNIDHLDFNKYRYKDISIDGVLTNTGFDGVLMIDDPNLSLQASGIINYIDKVPEMRFALECEKARLGVLNLASQYPESALSFSLQSNFSGKTINDINGKLTIDKLLFSNNHQQIAIDYLIVNADNHSNPQTLTLNSPLVNAKLEGRYTYNTILTSIQSVLSKELKALFDEKLQHSIEAVGNNISLYLSVENSEKLSSTLNLPLTIYEKSTFVAQFNDKENSLFINADIPDIEVNNMRFRGTSLEAKKPLEQIQLLFNTTLLGNKGVDTKLALAADALHNQLTTKLKFENNAENVFAGSISATTTLIRNLQAKLPDFNIAIDSTDILLNRAYWNIRPSNVSISNGVVSVSQFSIAHNDEFLQINGSASAQIEDQLKVSLNKISLDYIFDLLNMDNVHFGGIATGDFLLSNLTATPIINTQKFDVNGFAFNKSVLGDLHLFSRWENDTQGILLRGSISQEGYPDTKVDGYIYPTKDSIDIAFDANRLNLTFLRPFLDTVLKDLTGYVYGKATLYGKFSALTVVGDTYLSDLHFSIPVLNTSYSLSDSLHLTPNSIFFDKVTVYDKFKNTAIGTGVLRHNSFQNMSYDISIGDVHNFLVYNGTEVQNPLFWGTVFGTGAAKLRGVESEMDIDVNMRTNANSRFTFAVLEGKTAGDYKFLTIQDKKQETEVAVDNKLKEDLSKPQSSSVLNLNLQIDATPDLAMQLLLNPTTGDMLKAYGNGAIRLEYSNVGDVKMYGTYVLDKGSYSFNLEDVISRDFAIKAGSTVTFRGDPMTADLDIDAIYTVNANLRDLGEMGGDAKESRANTQVQTILSLSGDLQRPELAFDISLPTVNQDVDRWVKSIISSDDMMNKQIIYLLALGKFYTPEYLNTGANPNSGNELTSVLSSALSAQLGNILGQISDKLSVGTNISSEKGDYSDIEFEVALSSQLLNNRLLLNGNFGYKDNPTTNSSFIGDFDLEYLLTPNGNLRLKAYNHYNDRTYSVKSALTTQAVGFIFKRDFTKVSELFQKLTFSASNEEKRTYEKKEKKSKK